MKTINLRDLELIYPMRWHAHYYQINPLINAAYPQMKLSTDVIMVHAKTRACLKLAIKLAEHLGLLYFGYRDPQTRDIFSLQFINQELLLEHLEETISSYRVRFNPKVSVMELNKFERSWFISTFWQQLLSDTLIKKTLKQGLVLADLQQALRHKEKRMAILLGGDLASFDLIIDTLKPNDL